MGSWQEISDHCQYPECVELATEELEGEYFGELEKTFHFCADCYKEVIASIAASERSDRENMR